MTKNTNKNTIEDIYGLTPMQEGILYHCMGDSEKDLYHEQFSFTIKWNLDFESISKSFEHLLYRYDILRAVILYEELDKPRQVILKNVNNPVLYFDIREKENIEEIIEQYKVEDRKSGFDLSKGNLIKLTLFRIEDTKYIFVWSFHHIIMDGWCLGILMNEFISVYKKFKNNQPVNLIPHTSFKEYVNWIRSINTESSVNYWNEYLSGYDTIASIPLKNENNLNYNKGEYLFKFSKHYTNILNQIAQNNSITLSSVFQSLWAILLSKYNNTRDVVFGLVVSGRSPEIKGIEKMVGLFINTIAVRISYTDNDTIIDLIKKVQKNFFLSQQHFNLPLVDIQSQSDLKNNLFNHIFAFENFPIAQSMESSLVDNDQDKESIELINVDLFDQINYDYGIIVNPGEEFCIRITYNKNKIEEHFIKNLFKHLEAIIQQIDINPLLPICELNLLTKEERTNLLESLNSTQDNVGYVNKTLIDLFEDQLLKNPDNICVGYKNQSLTYKGIDDLSAKIAFLLQEKGVGRDDIVAMLCDRTIEMLIGILGILKAGCAYLPIDLSYPHKRIELILSDSEVEYVIVHEDIQSEKKTTKRLELMDKMFNKSINKERVKVPEFIILEDEIKTPTVKSELKLNNPRPDSLAYIIYTSGTTGNPKGAMIEHRNIVHLLEHTNDYFKFSEKDNWSLFHSYCFDFSVWEIFGPLCTGGKSIVLEDIIYKDPVLLYKVLLKNQITVLNQTPTSFYGLINIEQHKQKLNLRYVIFGGEALIPSKLKGWSIRNQHTKLINMYGITETTVHVTLKELADIEINSRNSTIGVPIYGNKCYVLDEQGMIMPVGVPGELYVGGLGVCRGYLNNASLSMESFFENPFVKGEMLYKTGDLVLINKHHELEYLGRIDNQVQIKGFRIELSEIENVLLRHENIEQAVVLEKTIENGRTLLSAYYVSTKELEAIDIRHFLGKQLPEYMIPLYFTKVDSIPLTSNNKVNKNKLLSLQSNILQSESKPKNETEKLLHDIWTKNLNLKEVGVDENYFVLGGDSIRAIQLLSKINREFKSNLRITDIFSHNTIISLAKIIDSKRGKSTINENKQILSNINSLKKDVLSKIENPQDIEDVYPMSDIQKGMVFFSVKNPNANYYHEQVVFPFEITDFDYGRLLESINLLIAKHEIFRTTFDLYRFKEPVQIVYSENLVNISYFDLRQHQISNTKEFLNKILQDDLKNKYSLDNEFLWRLFIYQFKTNQIVIFFSHHHTILDGWSRSNFITELHETYFFKTANKNYVPIKLQMSYKDFIINELQYLDNNETLNFWKEELKNNESMFTDISVSNQTEIPVERYYELVSQQKVSRLEKTSQELGISLKSLFFAAFSYSIKLFSQVCEFTLGIVDHQRPVMEDSDKVLGCFLNTLPIKIKVSNNITWRQFIQDVDKKINLVKEFSGISLYNIQKIVKGNSEVDGSLFDVFFNYTDFHTFRTEVLEKSSLSAPSELIIEAYENTNTLMDFNVDLTTGDLAICVVYKTQIFNTDRIKKQVEYFKRIIDLFIYNLDNEIDHLHIIEDSEKKKLLHFLNGDRVEYPKNETVLDLLEKQTKFHPNKTAVIYKNEYFTYQKFLELTNKFAAYLTSLGVIEGTIVPIISDRSSDMFVSIFAVLRAGGVYLPISTSEPLQRIKYILSDCNARVIITHRGDDINYGDSYNKVVLNKIELTTYKTDFVKSSKNPSTYLIYTSGTTGKPKGVLVNNSSLINRINWMQSAYPISNEDRVLHKTPISFDVSIWELFWWVFSGTTVYILPANHEKIPDKICVAINKIGISVVHFVPSMLNLFLNSLKNTSGLDNGSSLKYVFSSGEALAISQVEFFNTIFNSDRVRLINLYGPTEATVDVSYFNCDEIEGQMFVPIGKPIYNTKLIVVDKNNNIQPIGVPGELLIQGENLAAGYLNNVNLTNDRFINFCLHDKHYTMYKTGDLVQYESDGNIRFFNRIDNQIKIRGNRIELGEIECALNNLDSVESSVVLAKEDTSNNSYLVAYFIGSKNIDSDFLMSQLKQKLPDYMIPSYIVKLNHFPTTPNGKVNIKHLKQLDDKKIQTNHVIEKPETKEEEALLEIWKSVLERPEISINDNFFLIGGDSIKSLQILGGIKQKGYNLNMIDIFDYPTIKQLSGRLTNNKIQIPQTEVTGNIPLIPIQKRFFIQKNFDLNNFSQSVTIYSKDGFNEQMIKKAFAKIIEHHDALRITFNTNDKVTQFGNKVSGKSIGLEVFDLRKSNDSQAEFDKITEKIYKNIDITTGSLYQLALFNFIDGDRLLLIIHHLVVDGISWRILLEDLEHLFENYNNNKILSLPPKTTSFKDWSEYLEGYYSTGSKQKEKEYWLSIIEKNIDTIPKNVNNLIGEEYKTINLSINASYTEKLLNKVNYAYNTKINEILISGLVCSLNKVFKLRDIGIMMEGHGRENLDANVDLSRTVGWFATMYPVYFNITNINDYTQLVKNIKETLRQTPNNGLGYGILKYSDDHTIKTEVDNQEPEILFNYLGQFSGSGIERKSLFQFEKAGQKIDGNNKNEFLIEINGALTNGILSFNISYNCNSIQQKSIDTLVEVYKSELLSLIDHCISVDKCVLTPSDFVYKGLSIQQVDQLSKNYNIRDIYPLTSMQSGILFHFLYQNNTETYFEQASYTINKEINVESFTESIKQLLSRYEILNSLFITEGLEQPIQLLLNDLNVDIHFENLEHSNNNAEIIADYKINDRLRGFKLSEEPAIRFALFKLNEREFEFVWSFHHILFDGTSLGILIADFFALYTAAEIGTGVHMEQLVPYKVYIDWLQTLNKEISEKYWKNYLQDYKKTTGLPTILNAKNKVATFNKEVKYYSSDGNVSKQLFDLATRNGVTLNNLIQAIWGLLLSRYCNTNDVLFGLVVSGRPSDIPGSDKMVGLFINTIPVRIQIEPKSTLSELFKTLQKSSINSEQHHYYSLTEIQSFNTLKNALFDHILVFENNNLSSNQAQSQNQAQQDSVIINDIHEQTNYDFHIDIATKDEITFKLVYNSLVYKSEVIEDVINNIKLLVSVILKNENVTVEHYFSSIKEHINNESIEASNQPSFIENNERQYWLNQISPNVERVSIDADLHNNYNSAVFYQSQDVDISSDINQLLRKYAKGNDYALNVIVMFSIFIALKKFTGETDLTIGTPVYSQSSEDHFINDIIPIRFKIRNEWTIKQSIEALKDIILKGISNQNYPIDTLLYNLGMQVENDRSPLFGVGVVYENLQNSKSIERLRPDMLFKVRNENEKLYINIEYDSDLYSTQLIEQMQEHVKSIFNFIVNNIEAEISEIQVLSEKYINKVLQEFNAATTTDLPNKTYFTEFLNVVKKYPNRIAVQFEDMQVTYKQLHNNAVYVGKKLKECGIQKDAAVAIYMDRSINMLIGILGIWHAGGYYIPLDLDYPEKRINSILNDALVNLIVIDNTSGRNPKLKNISIQKISIDSVAYPIEDTAIGTLNPDSLAYVIYTSGSTGLPKGVMIQQDGMMNHLYAKINDLKLNKDSFVSQNSSQTFDISIWQFFSSLLVGGKTIIYSNKVILNPSEFIPKIIKHELSILEVVPSYLAVLLNHLEQYNIYLNSLNYLITTGEEINKKLMEDWYSYHPKITLVNAYGPTEASDDITHYFISKQENREIPIGKPVQNMRIYMVDDDNQLCPPNFKGEICVAGIGVGRGYLNDPEKTNKSFVKLKINNENIDVYKTGDIGSWDNNGIIRFFGRKDFQVKISGFRIELGEIETLLNTHDQINKAIVVAKERQSGNSYLYAFYTSNREIDTITLEEFLSNSLPHYMIPHYLVRLKDIPLTSNGKVDRKALPYPEISESIVKKPTGIIQEKLVEIWADVLNIDVNKISIDDNFFHLGGHSLNSTILLLKINSIFKLNLNIVQIFENPSIVELSGVIEKIKVNKSIQIKRSEKKEYYPTSFSQKGVFIQHYMENNTSYNVPFTLKIIGEVNIRLINEVFTKLTKRHEALRSAFFLNGTDVFQKVENETSVKINYIECNKKDIIQTTENLIEKFELSTAPLFKISLVKVKDDNFHLLVLDIHHIIIDGFSDNILVNDFMNILNNQKLEELPYQYKDFCIWEQSKSVISKIESQRKYWIETYKDINDIETNYPIDFPLPSNPTFETSALDIELGINETKILKKLAQIEKVTPFNIMLSVFYIFLYQITRNKDIIIGTVSNGREFAGAEKIIGLFAKIFPIRNSIDENVSFINFNTRVQKNLLEAYKNQYFPFEHLIKDLGVMPEINKNAFFDVIFSFNNNEGNATDNYDNSTSGIYPYVLDTKKYSKYFLTVICEDTLDKMLISFEYRKELFLETTINLLLSEYQNIIKKVLNNPKTTIKKLLDDTSMEKSNEDEKVSDLDFSF